MNRQIDRIVLLISFSIIASLLLIACAWLILRRSQEAQPTENLDYKRQEWESKDIPYVPIVNHKTLNESFTEKDTNAFKRNVNMALLEKFPDDVFLFMDWVWILDRPIAAILICWKKLPECEMGIIKAPSKFPKTVQNNFCWKVGIDESQKEVIFVLTQPVSF